MRFAEIPEQLVDHHHNKLQQRTSSLFDGVFLCPGKFNVKYLNC